MRALIDTDVVLDLLMARTPFNKAAFELFALNEQGKFEGYVSASTPLNAFYIARKVKGDNGARQAVRQLLAEVRVCPITYAVLTDAFTLPFTDYEDAVQHACATAGGLEAIVTRNLGDYKNAMLPIFAPTDFLNHLKAQQS